jgi:hypothetical protein
MTAIRMEDIQRVVAMHYEMDLRLMSTRLRARHAARPRMVAMRLCREFTSRSYPEIGRAFGGRDHTTVLSAFRRIGALSDADPEFAAVVASIRAKLAVFDAARFEMQACQVIGFFCRTLPHVDPACPCPHCGHSRKR